MANPSWTARLVSALILAQLLLAAAASAQVPLEQPAVMENVFYNVVWGSLFGILLASASAVIEAQDKSAPAEFGDSLVQGATFGGLLGLGLGIWLATSGDSFDPKQSLFFVNEPHFQPVRPFRNVAARSAPIVFETSVGQPFRITGFRATVLDLKF